MLTSPVSIRDVARPRRVVSAMILTSTYSMKKDQQPLHVLSGLRCTICNLVSKHQLSTRLRASGDYTAHLIPTDLHWQFLPRYSPMQASTAFHNVLRCRQLTFNGIQEVFVLPRLSAHRVVNRPACELVLAHIAS